MSFDLEDIRREVAVVRGTMLDLLAMEPCRIWDPSQLMDAAAPGVVGTVPAIALYTLGSDGLVVMSDDGQIIMHLDATSRAKDGPA